MSILRASTALALGTCLVLGTASAAPPGLGQHFDCSDGGSTSCASDDTGCVSQTKNDPIGFVNALKCGDGTSRAIGKAIAAVIACHRKQADLAARGTVTDDEACETNGPKSAKGKLDAARAKLRCTNAQTIGATNFELALFAGEANPNSLDSLNGQLYCSGTTDVEPSGDDAGKVPDKSNLSCEDTTGKELGKLANAIVKCHVKMNDQFFAGKEFDEEACEEGGPKSAVGKFDHAMDRLDAKGTCTDACNDRAHRNDLRDTVKALIEATNEVAYPCPGTTTSTTTSTTTTVTTPTTTTTTSTTIPCSCPGGSPSHLTYTTQGTGSGTCGNLRNDAGTAFLTLACGGLYFGGDGVAFPLPEPFPDQATSVLRTFCTTPSDPTQLTLGPTTPADAGGNRCSGGSNHHNTCTADANCPGGTCKLLTCTSAGCLFGPPLPLPDETHGAAATSVCLVQKYSQDVTGTASCSTGRLDISPALLTAATVFLTGDLLPNRCVGGSTPGAPCGAGCGNLGNCPGCCPGGTCVNDTGRCTDTGNACCTDGDCPSGLCQTGMCAGGANGGKGCSVDADCPGGTCSTLIQPCPICNPASSKCNGGPNDGLACTAGDSALNAAYPTSHDCPPPPPSNVNTVAINATGTTETTAKTAVDNSAQTHTFCGYCTNAIGKLANPAVACTTDADCAALSGFPKCRQRTPGAFTASDVARTITETGARATGITVGGPPVSATLAAIGCVPPTFNPLVDSSADIPGPAATAVPVAVQLLP